jgi:hypothetical protein
MAILHNIFGKSSASPDPVSFDVSRYEFQGVRDRVKVWHTGAGDALGLYFFARQPDIPSGLASTLQLRESYASRLGDKFRVIECRVQALDGVSAVGLIVGGLDPQTGGSVYIGSLTLPFRDFSYVIKMQTYERGDTGLRETMLIDRALGNGTGSIQDGLFVPNDWSFDDEQFDSLVPDHPLPRLRREIKSLAQSVKIAEQVKRKAAFALPPEID